MAPSSLHEVLVDLFREQPLLAVEQLPRTPSQQAGVPDLRSTSILRVWTSGAADLVSNWMVMGSMDTSWVTLPFAGERLASVVHIGNGKNAKFLLTFADGRRVMLSVYAARVEADRGVVVDVSGWGDLSLRIEYLGSDLYLHSGRFGFGDDDDEFVAWFLAEAQK